MTDCDLCFDAPPEQRQAHLGVCPDCARLARALALGGATPAPVPLAREFFARLELALERPEPTPLWTSTVRRVRHALTAAAAVAALITVGWVGREVPAAFQVGPEQVQRVLHRAELR